MRRRFKNMHTQCEDSNHRWLFDTLRNKSNQEKTLLRADLILNPIKFTASINGDSYVKQILDFSRNGRTLHTTNGKITWNERKQRYTQSSYFIYFSFLVEKRDPHF